MANEYLKCEGRGKEKNAVFHHSLGDGSICRFCGYLFVPGQCCGRWCPELMVRETVRRMKGEPHLCDSCIKAGGMLAEA